MKRNASKEGDICQRLRDATAEAHRRLETELDLLRAPSRDRFTRLLERFHGFHSVWEPAVEARLADGEFFAPRRKLAAIEGDLAALGRPVDGRMLPACAEAAALVPSREAALGSLYVLEGSTLGGQVIARRLADAAWLPPDGLRYFIAYGEATGAMWQAFRQRLRSVSRPDADRAIMAAAVATFGLLHEWLRPVFEERAFGESA